MTSQRAYPLVNEAKKKHPHHPKGPHMVPALVSIVNASSNLHDEDVARAALVMGKQLAEASQFWGQMPAVEFVPKGGTPQGMLCTLDETIDVQGAEGYHDEGPDGRPYIKLLSDAGWTVTLSHELLELAQDAAANLWAFDNKGKLYARELCDADQGGTYEIDGVEVSNYMLPAFFDPNAARGEKLDRLSRVPRPLVTMPEGYQIVWPVDQAAIGQVFGARSSGLVHHLAGPVLIEFGPEFPREKISGKVAKMKRKHAHRSPGFNMGQTP